MYLFDDVQTDAKMFQLNKIIGQLSIQLSALDFGHEDIWGTDELHSNSLMEYIAYITIIRLCEAKTKMQTRHQKNINYFTKRRFFQQSLFWVVAK